MRALLVNPQTPHSFWTFKHSCDLFGVKAVIAPLGLVTVAALLPDEWEFRLVDLNTGNLTQQDWDWADAIMISAMLVQREGLLATVAEAKQRAKTVVVGGAYPTSVPNEVLDAGADFLIRGEAENTIPLFLAALREGEKRGVFEQDVKPEMISSPVPRFDLLRLKDYLAMGIQTSRGCPFDCEFCDVVNLYGRKCRYKSADQVIRELEALYQLGWRRDVFICDDNFVGNRGSARAIVDKLIPWMKGHGEPFSFWTQASVQLGNDIELINMLTEANFQTVFVGIETPDEDVLAQNRKYHNISTPLAQSLNNLRKNGLSVVASFVLGFDHEQKGAAYRICEFVEENSIPMVMLNMLNVLPNTSLWDRLQREGRLLETGSSGAVTGGSLNYVPTRPAMEIVEEYVQATNRLYEPSAYLSRTYEYFLEMRPTRAALARARGETIRAQSPHYRPPLREKLRDLKLLIQLCWREGVRPRYRFQFWRQLWGIYRNNPSRIIRYLNGCGLGENLFRLRELVERRVWSETSVAEESCREPGGRTTSDRK